MYILYTYIKRLLFWNNWPFECCWSQSEGAKNKNSNNNCQRVKIYTLLQRLVFQDSVSWSIATSSLILKKRMCLCKKFCDLSSQQNKCDISHCGLSMIISLGKTWFQMPKNQTHLSSKDGPEKSVEIWPLDSEIAEIWQQTYLLWHLKSVFVKCQAKKRQWFKI